MHCFFIQESRFFEMRFLSQSLPLLDRIFVFTAAIGTIAVLLRAVMLFAGGDLDGEDAGHLEDHGDDAGGDGFRFLSVLGLASFFMMFGLVGIALSRQTRAGMGPSILGGLLAGLAALWIIARLFRLARGLQSSGTIPPQAAAGCVGIVYLTIPAGGIGRVTVRIGQRTREMDAIHAAGTTLPTGTPVRVVRVERSLAVVQTLPESELSCLNS